MELASDLVARELPALETVGGTTHASVSSNRISAALLHPWETFLVDMWRALQSLNLNIEIPETDETEDYMVGNERGMTTRFVKNVCDPVGKALSITRLSSMVFGDIHSATLNPPSIPDVTILRRSAIPAIHREDLSIVAIGELKTCCTVMLRSNIFDLPVGERLNVEPHIGQVVDHMRQYSLKYSFLSTYTSTVFIRRLEDYRFEISQPVLREARHFSTRECMVAFCAIAAEDTRFTESPDFSELRLRGPAIPGMQASIRASSLRRLSELPSTRTFPFSKSTPTGGHAHIGLTTVFFEHGGAATFFNCTRTVSASAISQNAAMEVVFNGQKCFAKVWPSQRYESFAQEAFVYDRLLEAAPDGSPFFPSLIAHGPILCSSAFPDGYVLILSWVDGVVLTEQWPQLHRAEKDIIRRDCRDAVAVFRQIGIYVLDCGLHNIIYNPHTHKTVMTDFEMIGACPAELRTNLEGPELSAIFGDERSSIPGG